RVLVGERIDAGQEHLLDGALDRPHGQALLEQPSGLLLVEDGEGRLKPGGRRGALTALARQRDRRGDVVGLREGLPERLDLGQLELPVAALRTAGLGIAEAALPAAQRVRADAQHRRCCVRAYRAHGERYPGFASFAQSAQANLQAGKFRPRAGEMSPDATRWGLRAR